MRKLIVTIVSVLILSSCATMDSALSKKGIITDKYSKMDGLRIVRMSTVYAGDENMVIEFGLYWDDVKKDKAILSVEYKTGGIFDPKKPFEIKIDGMKYEFPPLRESDLGDVDVKNPGQISAYVASTKSYWISKDQILKLANANEAVFRIWFSNGEFFDGEVAYMHKTMQSFVPFSFRRFYDTVWSPK